MFAEIIAIISSYTSQFSQNSVDNCLLALSMCAVGAVGVAVTIARTYNNHKR